MHKEITAIPKKLTKAPTHVHFETLERTDKKKPKDPTHYFIYLILLVFFFFIVICKPVTMKNTA